MVLLEGPHARRRCVFAAAAPSERTHAIANTQKKAVETAMEDLQRRHLIPTQKQAFLCSAKCCDSHSDLGTLQQCAQSCQRTIAAAQEAMFGQLGEFQERFQRCTMRCQDAARVRVFGIFCRRCCGFWRGTLAAAAAAAAQKRQRRRLLATTTRPPFSLTAANPHTLKTTKKHQGVAAERPQAQGHRARAGGHQQVPRRVRRRVRGQGAQAQGRRRGGAEKDLREERWVVVARPAALF